MDLDFQTLKYFFQLSPDLLAVVSKEGKFIYLNNTWRTYLGYELEEMIGRPFLDFVAPEDQEKTRKEMESYFESPPKQRPIFENRYVGKNGEDYVLQWKAIYDEESERFYCVSRDVTPYRTISHLKKVLHETHYESTKMDMVNQIASELTNEISDPLFHMGGHAELIEMHVGHTPIKAEYIKEQALQIRTSLQKVNERLKALNRITTSLSSEGRETILLVQLIRDLGLLLQRRLNLSGLHFEFQDVDPEVHVSYNRTELCLFLYEIFSSALSSQKQDKSLVFKTQEKTDSSNNLLELIIESKNCAIDYEQCFSTELYPLPRNLDIAPKEGSPETILFKMTLPQV